MSSVINRLAVINPHPLPRGCRRDVMVTLPAAVLPSIFAVPDRAALMGGR